MGSTIHYRNEVISLYIMELYTGLVRYITEMRLYIVGLYRGVLHILHYRSGTCTGWDCSGGSRLHYRNKTVHSGTV